MFIAAIVAGIVLRLYGLGQSGIFFYDEALYLDHTRGVLEFIQRHHPQGLEQGWKALDAYLHFVLNFSKPIWLLIVDSRYFFGPVTNWDYARFAACFFGILTIPLMYLFAKRFSLSKEVAFLSAGLLAILPAHVFYSRVGLQEAFSVFVVLAGFYCYLFPRDFGRRTFLAGIFLAMAFLANYRLIILPVLLVATELWLGAFQKGGVRWRHLVWATLTFFAVMVIVGSLLDGAHTRFVFSWVFHQGDLAAQKSSWLEFLAYPYYLFRLENAIFALFFLGGGYFLLRNDRARAWPFLISCLQMFIFSMASDRGARYIAVVLPFVVLSAAIVMDGLYQHFQDRRARIALGCACALMAAGLLGRSWQLALSSSDQRQAVGYMLSKDAKTKFVSSQEMIERLYVADPGNVAPAPVDFGLLREYYQKGYRYLVLDPQAYIAFPSTSYKWGLPLCDYLGFVDRQIAPVKVFPHFNRAAMERFVFEHSDNLAASCKFLSSPDLPKMSTLRVYDLNVVVPVLSAVIEKARAR